MNIESLRSMGRKVITLTLRPITERTYGGGWKQFVFDAKAQRLSNDYMKGEISLKEVHVMVRRINESGRFPGLDMKGF